MSDGHAPGGAVDTDDVEALTETESDTPGGAPRKGRRARVTGWRSRDILRTAALVIAMYIAIQLLWFANALVLTVFMGVLFGLAVGSGVDRLERHRVPRGVAAALIVVTFFAVLGGIFALMAPTISKQSLELRRKLPEAAGKAEEWFAKRQQGVFGMFLGGSSTAAKDSGKTSADSGSQTADTGKKATGAAIPDTGAEKKTPTDSTRADSGKTGSGRGRPRSRHLISPSRSATGSSR